MTCESTIERAPAAQPCKYPTMGVAAILFVDDSRMLRKLGGVALARAGFKIWTAENGKVGLGMFERLAGQISAVVLDVEMPVMGGEELFGHIRKLSPRTPIVLSTSRKLSELGSVLSTADGYVQKPWTVRELTDALNRVGVRT